MRRPIRRLAALPFLLVGCARTPEAAELHVLAAASLSLTLLLGTPLAWLLAFRTGRLARAIEALVQLPIVVPPAVAGVALLLAFGRHGLEPMASLDGPARATAWRILAERLSQRPVACLCVTHEPLDAEVTGWPVAVLESGRIVQQGSLASLREAPATPGVRAILEA